MGCMDDRSARWSEATTYPDMWVDPDKDPRGGDGVSPDGELATLQDFLANYRMTLLMKCEGLDAEQLARRSVPPSTMSLLGLVRHLAEVERDWRNWIGDGEPLPKLYGPDGNAGNASPGGDDGEGGPGGEGDAGGAGGGDFDGAVAEQAEVDAAYAALAREQAATDAALAEHPDLGERLGKDGFAVRELMVHRIEEYARHCGHADLLRERVDGRVGQ
ncbi:DinB family protein [Streptomyces sp. NPDC006012]|uniref:DinB family protein n=1 Tax=Streptomyces sp. NPDC006012 TaxID=3364739 RepID=UPI00368D3E65